MVPSMKKSLLDPLVVKPLNTSVNGSKYSTAKDTIAVQERR